MSFETRLRGRANRDNIREASGDMGQLNRMAPVKRSSHRAGSWQSERLKGIADKSEMTSMTSGLLHRSKMMDDADADREYAHGRDAVGDKRYEDNTTYNRGRDKVGDARYEDEKTYRRGRDTKNDDRYDDNIKYARGRDAKGDARYEDDKTYRRGRDTVGDERYEDDKTYRRGRDTVGDERYDDSTKFNRDMANKQYLRGIAQDAINKKRFGLDEKRYNDNKSYRDQVFTNSTEQDRRKALEELRTKYHPDDVKRIMADPQAVDRYMKGQPLGRPTRALAREDIMLGANGQPQSQAPMPGPMQAPNEDPYRLRALLSKNGRGAGGAGAFVKNLQMLGSEAARAGIPEDQLYVDGKPTNALMGLAQYMDQGLPFDQAVKAARMKTTDQIGYEGYQADKELSKDSSWYWPDSDEVDDAQDRISDYWQKNPKRALSRQSSSTMKYKSDEIDASDVIAGITGKPKDGDGLHDQEDYKVSVDAYDNMLTNPKENAGKLAEVVEGLHQDRYGKSMKFSEIFSPSGAGTDFWKKKASKEFAKELELPEDMDLAFIEKFYESQNGAGSFDKAVNTFIFNDKNSGVMTKLKGFRKEFGNNTSSKAVKALRNRIPNR